MRSFFITKYKKWLIKNHFKKNFSIRKLHHRPRFKKRE